MATPKQIQFVSDLKTELGNPAYGLDSVVEWIENYPTLVSGNYVCAINNAATSAWGARSAVTENVYYQIFLLIKQTELTDITIESVRLGKIEQVKTALYNVLAASTPSIINSGILQGENQVLNSSLFDEAIYIGYTMNLNVNITNSY